MPDYTFSFENFSLNAANLLVKFVNQYDALKASNGANALEWSADYPPIAWAGNRFESLVIEAQEMMADTAAELDRLRALRNTGRSISIPR